MSLRIRQAVLAILSACSCAVAGAAPQPLDDAELGQVTGRDGISFAAHISINDPSLVGAVADSRLSLGFNGDGTNRYIVLKNLRGTVDMFAVSLSVQNRSDGNGDYIAIGLPGYVRYTNFGFESLSVQTDPSAPVTGSLGSMNLNGVVNLTGEVRIWTH